MKSLTAIVLAAGKGTRMKSATAKVLHPLLGRSLIEYPVAACRGAGVGQIVCVIGHQGDQVQSALADPQLSYAIQSEQKGTGHAVLCTRDALAGVTGTALILCGDVPLIRPETLSRLCDTHQASAALVTVLSMQPEDPTGYGRLLRDTSGRLQCIREHRDCTARERETREVNTGTYAVELPWLWEALDGIDAGNDQGEYYLTDIVAAAAGLGKAASLILEDPAEVMGINSRAHLAEASAILRDRINLAWMEAGVTLEDPATTWIEPGVKLEADTTVGPGCRLSGNTCVSTGTRIEQGCVIHDSNIGAEAHIKPYCVIHEAQVGNATQVGPFAHLRPGAVMLEAARVGNFVEMKKTTLGKGSKANHLTYLGDTTVGEKTNIGAGTITCNYDGVNKFTTQIGDGAFIGSNSSLVAPVSIGSGATVAAGSTITHDVPELSLGVARGKQRTVANWAARKPKK